MTILQVLFFFSICLNHVLAFGLKCSTLILPKALTEYKSELRDDPIISTHLTKLYDNLLEQNLIRVIEPFSRVQVIAQMLYIHRKRTLQFLGGQSL